jgi:hypothetical protein
MRIGIQDKELNVLVPLFLCEITDVYPTVTKEGKHCLHFKATTDKGGKLAEVNVPLGKMGDSFMLANYLLDLGVKVNPKMKQHLEGFMLSLMEKFNNAKASNVVIPYGWYQPEDGGGVREAFVYGGKAFRADGTIGPSGVADPQVRQYYFPRGTVGPWHTLSKIITDQHRPALEVLLATTFAGPLMFVPAIYNGAICAFSRNGGAKKSTSIRTGCGVWASPLQSKLKPDTSPLAFMKKMGAVQNLPIYIDEINDMPTMETIAKSLGKWTEGGQGDKLNPDGTLRKAETWQTLVIVGGNQSLRTAVRNVSQNTDASLLRVFELPMEVTPESPGWRGTDVEKLVNILDHNYGHIGLEYAKVIGHDPIGIEKIARDIMEKFSDDIKSHITERFWLGVCSMILAGATIANQHLGTDFHVDEMEAYLKELYLEQRAMNAKYSIVGGTVERSIDAMTEFFKAYAATTAWTDTCQNGRGASKPIHLWHGPNTDHKAKVEVQWVVDYEMVRLSRSTLDNFLKQHHHETESVLRHLEKEFGASLSRANLAARLYGYSNGPENIVQIPVPKESPWRDNLTAYNLVGDAAAAPGPVQTPIQEAKAVLDKGLAAGLAQAQADMKVVTGG